MTKPKPKKKKAALSVTIAGVAMASMLGTWQSQILRVPHGEGIDLVFRFPANQSFKVTFKGDQLVAAEMRLVVGLEPTRSAMTVVQNQTAVDTVNLFSGLECDDQLDVAVTSDEGFSLNDVDMTLAELLKVDDSLAKMFGILLDMDIEPTANAGEHGGIRQHLADMKKKQTYQAAA
jgi:hypothetical protein